MGAQFREAKPELDGYQEQQTAPDIVDSNRKQSHKQAANLTPS